MSRKSKSRSLTNSTKPNHYKRFTRGYCSFMKSSSKRSLLFLHNMPIILHPILIVHHSKVAKIATRTLKRSRFSISAKDCHQKLAKLHFCDAIAISMSATLQQIIAHRMVCDSKNTSLWLCHPPKNPTQVRSVMEMRASRTGAKAWTRNCAWKPCFLRSVSAECTVADKIKRLPKSKKYN